MIYELSIAGLGGYTIAKQLNAKNVPVFGPSPKWDQSSIHNMLRNRATVGEHQPKQYRQNKEFPIGDPIPNYYPAVIEESLFQAAQAARRKNLTSGRGRKGRLITNLFAGLLAVCLRGNDVARRLMTIPGIGPVGATALAASVTDPHQFRSGRQFAAWLGLTPLQKSSGGKERLGRITKMGDKYLRKLLVVGMTALVRRAKQNPAVDPRLADLLARKPTRVATVAMANKTARVIWAIMSRGETYRTGHQPTLAA